ncbi:MAG TPA: amidase [Rudaea sp.]|nr:amidase [Rudaea sp.]
MPRFVCSVRHAWFGAALLSCVTLASAAAPDRTPEAASFPFDEATIAELGRRMQNQELTSHALVQAYLDRIAAIDKAGPAINAIIELNPDALAIADRLDAERKSGKVRGPLHGIPVLIKDNIATADRMHTTAGSLALADSIAAQDSTVAANLRAAGAVILGKTNLSEWANFRSTHSTSGWSGRGGQTKNPYALDRNPCGSSSGTGAAIAANLAAAGIGTETDGSIICPSAMNGLVGIKPTLGLVSRAGIVPIAHSQDTAGPMARSVADAAVLLDAIVGADARDAASKASDEHRTDYSKHLDANALKGARIGVVRKLAGFNPDVDSLLAQTIAALKAAGAVVVDPVELPNLGKYDEAELVVLEYEFKHDVDTYLGALPATANAPRSLADLIAFNGRERAREMPWFGQELFEKSQARGPLTDHAYLAALARSKRFSGALGIDAALKKHKLDALVAPSVGPAPMTDLVNGDPSGGGSSTAPAAVAGYPDITVPAGFVHGLPVGLSFFAGAWSEPKLIGLAYAFEQATHARKPPQFLRTIDSP